MNPNNKISLFGKTLNELKAIVESLSLPLYTASQIADWLYKKEVSSIDEMSNLSKKARAVLSEKYQFGLFDYIQEQQSLDGTKKYLFPTKTGNPIETAMIPDKERNTVCVSTQVGCKMNCSFCFTGKQGFQSQLTAGEILNQFRNIPEFTQMSNIVYMGMGEPLDNIDEVLKSLEILTSDYGYAWSSKRITVSSIGILPALKRILNESKVHLAISLHSPFDEERLSIMPVQKAYPIQDIITVLKDFDFGLQRRISFEYIMLGHFNDSLQHADALADLIKGSQARVNLIRFHAIPDTALQTTDEERMLQFQQRLKVKGIFCTIRASRGQDIYAACGLLSTKELIKKDK